MEPTLEYVNNEIANIKAQEEHHLQMVFTARGALQALEAVKNHIVSQKEKVEHETPDSDPVE